MLNNKNRLSNLVTYFASIVLYVFCWRGWAQSEARTALDSFVQAEDVPVTDGLLGLEYINKHFVAVGAQVSWSEDGVHWLSVEQEGGSMDLSRIAHGDGMYVASNRWGHLWVSEDLSDWIFLGSFQAAIVDLVYHDKMKTWFLAVAESGKYGNTDMIYRSKDGLHWQLLSIEGQSLRERWVSKLLPVGDGIQVQHQLGGGSIYSSDLIHWEKVFEVGGRYSSGWIIEAAHFVAGNGYMVNTSKANFATVSKDLRHWKRSERIDPNLDVHVFDMAFGQGRFVAVGNGSSRTPGNVYSSSDGMQWVSHTLPGDEVRALVGVAHGNGRFVVCSSNNRIYYSPKLEDVIPHFTSEPQSAKVAMGDDHLLTATLIEPGTSVFQWYKDDQPIPGATDTRWLIEDFDSSDAGRYVLQVTSEQQMVQSDEAIMTMDFPNPLNHWKQHPGPIAQDLRSVESNGELLVAVGLQGTIKSSKDGKIWEDMESGVRSDLYSVRWVKDQWFVVGDAGVLLKSLDGRSWELIRIQEESTSLVGVAYGPLGFVVAGKNGDLYQSADFSEWKSLTPLQIDGISAIAASSSEYLIVGDQGMIARSDDLNEWRYEWVWPDFRLTNVRYLDEAFHVTSLKNGYFVEAETGEWVDGSSAQTQLRYPMNDYYDVTLINGEPQFAANGFAGRTTNARMYSLSSGLDVYGITSHKNALIAVGQSGAIFVQSENNPWELYGDFPHFFDIAGKPGLVCVVGEGDPIRLSVDDQAFQSVVGLENEVLNAVAYGNDTFVAVGNAGLIATSANGLDWKTVKRDEEGLFIEVTYGNGVFVILTAEGRFLVGDGTSGWEMVSLEMADAPPTMVGFYDEAFVSNGSPGQMFRSKDGVDWQMIEVDIELPSSPAGVLQVNDQYILYSGDSKVAYTSDWIQWNIIDDFKFRQRGSVFGGGDDRYIEWLAWIDLFGYWKESPEQVVAINYPSPHRSFRLEWIGNRLYSVGGYGDIYYADFETSSSPALQIEVIDSNPFTISIHGQLGSKWQIDYKDDLSSSGEWIPMEEITLDAESVRWTAPDVSGSKHAFFKFKQVQ